MANASLPKGQTAKQPATGAGAKGGAKRAYHTKTRTGCKTCKIRRVRCDEEKPRCKRCVSTGRKCDGYDTTSNYSLPTAQWPPDNITASADLALVKSGKSPEELRSYRFFIDVTAPSVGGALNATLWNEELPRVCLHDPAIWHAIVSLGSAHESYVSGIPAGPDNVFTLKHYDSAIASLTSSYTPRGWWRALTLSTIFSAICVLEGRYEEARLHFRSGYNLISEFDTPHPPGTDLVTGQEVHKLKRLTSTFPVSLTSIRAAMIEFEMRENKANAKKVSQLPSLLSGKDSFASWRTYTSPSSSLPGECLNERNIGEAIRNGESLFMNILFSTMQHGNKLRKYYTEGRMHMLGAPGPTQEPFQRCFKELDDALRAFTAEFTTRVTQGWKKGDAELRQAWLSLCLIHATIRFMLRRDPNEPDEVKRLASLQLQGEGILDLAEKVMNLERNLGCIRSGGAIPNPTVMNPIVVVARTGVGLATRKRALDLLYRPRLEGLWDCLMGASYCKAIMDREAAATREYNEIGVERTWIDDYTARGYDAGEDEPEEDVHPMARIYGTEFPFVGGRRAILKLRTWREWLRGDEGEEFWIYW